MKKDPRFIQGIFKPINKDKFMGKYAVFRSSWERKFMLWADKNPNIIEWSSEQIVIPYRSPLDNKIHRYFVDNYIVLKEGDKIKKYLPNVQAIKF